MQACTRNSWTSFVVKFLAVKVCSVFPLQSKAFWTIDCNKLTWNFLSLINHCLAKLNYSTLLSEQGLKPWCSWYTIVDRQQPPASCLSADPPWLLLQCRFFEPPRDTKIGLKNRRVREVGDKIAVFAERLVRVIERIENTWCPGGGGGGTPRKTWRGCAARFPKPLPYLWPKSARFPTLFMTWPKISNPIYNLTLTSQSCFGPAF